MLALLSSCNFSIDPKFVREAQDGGSSLCSEARGGDECGATQGGGVSGTGGGNGIVVGSPVDLDGDGIVDGQAVDANGDGIVDGVDTNGDGLADKPLRGGATSPSTGGGGSGGSNGQTTGSGTGATGGGPFGVPGLDLPCDNRAQCAANRGLYACTLGGECIERCSANGCLGPQLDLPIERAVAVASGFLYETADTLDGLGNSLHTKSIWFWDEVNPPQQIQGTTDATLVFGANDFVYFQKSGTFFRVPRQVAAEPEQLATNLTKAWKNADEIMWSRIVDPWAGARYELWRLALTEGATPSLVAEGPHPYVAHNANYLITFASEGVLRAVNRSDNSAVSFTTTFAHVKPELVVADETFVFFSLAGTVVRARIADPSDQKNLTTSRIEWEERFWLEGEWVYWDLSLDGSAAGRTHRDLLAPPTTFDPLIAELGPGMLAVSKNRALFTFVTKDARFLALKDLPSVSCAAPLSCPPGLSCDTDAVCK